jgi:hypothetical protein
MVFVDHWANINKERQKLATKTHLVGKLHVQVCFDRSKPTLKVFDNTSFVELNGDEIEALKEFLLNEET